MTDTQPIFETHPDPLLQYDPTTRPSTVTGANPAFGRQFEQSVDEVRGEPLADALADLGFELDDDSGVDENTTGSGPLAPATEQSATNGRTYTLRAVTTDSEGYLLLTDVTRYVDQREALEAENSRLERFARTVSHDLRNPLEVAQSRLVAAEETGDQIHFEKTKAAHTRIRELIEDVLTLAKSGATISDTELVDLAEITREAWASVDADEATFTVDDDLGTVSADPERLQTVFENLFRNAVEHGDPSVTVSVDSLADGFTVADDGPGVPADKRDAVFEAGVSTGSGTTGLGLSIVSEIAAAHGWEVSLTESPTGGAQFEFQI